MKYILLFISIGFFIQLQAQHDIKPTEQFTIEGLVKSPFTFHLKDAAGYSSKKIDSVVITNHLKQPRGSIKHLRVILLKDILAKVERFPIVLLYYLPLMKQRAEDL